MEQCEKSSWTVPPEEPVNWDWSWGPYDPITIPEGRHHIPIRGYIDYNA